MSNKILRMFFALVIGFGLTGAYAWANDQVADEHGDEYEVTFNVDMSEAEDFDPEAHDVFVTGSMAEWAEPGSNPDFMMAPHADNPDIYTLTVTLPAGEYMYKYFLVEDEPDWDGGEWDGDPNREVVVNEDTEVNDVWAVPPVYITFNVDMSGAEDFDPEAHEVFVTGTFTGWVEPGSNPDFVLAPHEDDENIYTITVFIDQGEHMYKYFIVEDAPTWDGGEWDGDPNREINATEDMEVNDVWAVVPTSSEPVAEAPRHIELQQNYPNPFNPTTQIRYNLDQSAQVTLEVYNALGQRVATLVNQEHQAAGQHTYSFDGSNLSSGMYMYRLTAGEHMQTRVMTLIK
ncbi:T9SS type A sorting domain-containing protein [Balneolales bacterium ANBcel1]|nr:T9SS type A sorting domain-containing protein [Balneolales bacterium ANBcel1]